MWCCFVLYKSTIDAMFVLARLMVKYTAKKLKSIFCLGQPEEGI